MKRCALCSKRVWFWQCALASRFGYSHSDCIDDRLREEAAAALYPLVRDMLATIVELLFRLPFGSIKRVESEGYHAVPGMKVTVTQK